MATVLFRLTLFFLITFWGSLGVVAITLNILLHPLSFFYWKKREGQPESDCIYDIVTKPCVLTIAWALLVGHCRSLCTEPWNIPVEGCNSRCNHTYTQYTLFLLSVCDMSL